MPIVRTFACPECNHFLEVMLTAEQWDAEPPECPVCAAHAMRQEFKAPGIVGSNRARATQIAEDIAARDFNVADMKVEGYEGVRNKVRYKDQTPQNTASWGAATEALESAIASGRAERLKYGSGLDVLQSNLKNGTEPDLIALSKQRCMKVW